MPLYHQCPQRREERAGTTAQEASGWLTLRITHTVVCMKPSQLVSWFMSAKHPRVDSTPFLQEFRRQFRVPYQYFVDLNNELEGCKAFKRWLTGAEDRCGVKAASSRLLAALRYIRTCMDCGLLAWGNRCIRRSNSKFYSHLPQIWCRCLIQTICYCPIM